MPEEGNRLNYYNENDPRTAAWLRELIRAGVIPDGHVDERSIVDVQPGDLDGFCQCHFFAGIGGWSEALRLAGWPADKPVWSGSCPCQPLSCAGKRAGEKDERHLWPEFYRLISQCHPATIFGEQVASPDGLEWFDGISLDLEELGYAVGSSDLPAAGVGAPHIRQRGFWVADSQSARSSPGGKRPILAELGGSGATGRVDNPNSGRCEQSQSQIRAGRNEPVSSDTVGRVGNARLPGPQGRFERRDGEGERPVGATGLGRNAWSDYQLLHFRDGKTRRIKSGLEPLVDGLQGRVGLLRGYGNAIVPEVAAEFIQAFQEATCTTSFLKESYS